MQLKPGSRLRSTTCDTQVVVVRGTGDLLVTCGGAPMIAADAAPGDAGTPAPGHDGGTLLGKRYEDADGALEVLVVKPGAGSLGLGEALLAVKAAKQLPASD
jgi:hypothetical protein